MAILARILGAGVFFLVSERPVDAEKIELKYHFGNPFSNYTYDIGKQQEMDV